MVTLVIINNNLYYYLASTLSTLAKSMMVKAKIDLKSRLGYAFIFSHPQHNSPCTSTCTTQPELSTPLPSTTLLCTQQTQGIVGVMVLQMLDLFPGSLRLGVRVGSGLV